MRTEIIDIIHIYHPVFCGIISISLRNPLSAKYAKQEKEVVD